MRCIRPKGKKRSFYTKKSTLPISACGGTQNFFIVAGDVRLRRAFTVEHDVTHAGGNHQRRQGSGFRKHLSLIEQRSATKRQAQTRGNQIGTEDLQRTGLLDGNDKSGIET